MKIKKIIITISLLLELTFTVGAKNSTEKVTLNLLTESGVKSSVKKENTSLYSDEEETEESSVSLNPVCYGGRLSIPFFIYCLYQKEENTNFGIDLNSGGALKNVYFSIKTGNLKYSGGISKLKSPLLSSSISPFSSISPNVSPLTVTLPGYSSFNKPVSISGELNFFKQNIKINTLYDPSEEIYAFSIYNKIKKPAFQFCLTTGSFRHEENIPSVWFSENQEYYSKGNHWSTNGQFSYSKDFFSTLSTLSLFESPFKDLKISFKSENKIKTENFTFNFCGNYIPQELFTASSEKIKPYLQLKAGGFYKYKISFKQPVFIKTGINTYTKLNLEKDVNMFNCITGIQFTSPLSILTFSASINSEVENLKNNINMNIKNYTVKISDSFSVKKVNPVITANFTYKPSEEKDKTSFNHKYSLNLNYADHQKILFATSFSQTIYSTNLSRENVVASLKLNLSRKNVSYLLKFSLDMSCDS